MIRRINHRRSALAAITKQHLDQIYDLILQVYGDPETGLNVLQSIISTARRRYRFDRLEKYAQLWILRITVEKIQARYRRFLSEQESDYHPPLAPLSLEEQLCVLLHDRFGLNQKEMSAVLQLHAGRVARSLCYGHEKLASSLNYAYPNDLKLPLSERSKMQFALSGQNQEMPDSLSAYAECMRKVQLDIQNLPAHGVSEFESKVPLSELVQMFTQKPNWQSLSWKSKLAIESLGFVMVGAIAVIALPWLFSLVNTTAIWEGRFADMIRWEKQLGAPEQSLPTKQEIISADRLIASKDSVESIAPPAAEVADDFSDYDFPSGDSVDFGSAPVAPSRQNANVYRLIVQSANPREMIPMMKEVFANRKVTERERSGNAMPGGVFFDGITTMKDYPTLLEDVRNLKQMGKTQSYGNANWQNRNPNERARVIIWVQQI